MKQHEWILLGIGVALIAVSAATLKHFKAKQVLGPPGVKTSLMADSKRLNVEIPTNVPGYVVKSLDTSITLNMLPDDTSMAQVGFEDARGFPITVSTVLMGTDRTSIHQPQFCLRGGGWIIDDARSFPTTVHLDRPYPMDLPVMKLVATTTGEEKGQKVSYSGVYVYWFVAGDAVTADHAERMWLMSKKLVKTGELQRWAYISLFAPCLPGQEDVAFERVKKLMKTVLPEFQTVWPARSGP